MDEALEFFIIAVSVVWVVGVVFLPILAAVESAEFRSQGFPHEPISRKEWWLCFLNLLIWPYWFMSALFSIIKQSIGKERTE